MTKKARWIPVYVYAKMIGKDPRTIHAKCRAGKLKWRMSKVIKMRREVCIK